MIKYLLAVLYHLNYVLLRLFVRTTVLPDDLTKLGIDPHKPICYIMETPSSSNLAVLDKECMRLGLPSPRGGLGEGPLKQWRSVYSLIPRKGQWAKDRVIRPGSEKLQSILNILRTSNDT